MMWLRATVINILEKIVGYPLKRGEILKAIIGIILVSISCIFFVLSIFIFLYRF